MTMKVLGAKSFETRDEQVRTHVAFSLYLLKITVENFSGILTGTSKTIFFSFKG